jgi:cbb3-type cytochrome c oxidase subunit III
MKRTLWSALVIAVSVAACGGTDTNQTAATTTSTTSGDTTTSTTGTATTTTATTATTTTAGAIPEGATAAMVAAGETAFKGGICISCHGPDAKGTALAPNLTDDQWLNIDGSYDAIKKTIKTGVAKPKDPTHPTPMPPMGGAQLTDEQINDIGAYIYSLSHKG